MRPSPDAAALAVCTHDLRLLLVDLHHGTIRLVDRAEHDGGIFDVAWSHDGDWLAFAVAMSSAARTSCIRLARVRGGGGGGGREGSVEVIALTSGTHRDTSPASDPDARYVAFLSSRALRAVEDQALYL